MRKTLALLSICAIAAAGCWTAAADEIPTFRTLTCEKNCPAFEAAVAVNAANPRYPSKFTGREGLYVEALVDVHFTVATDGTVKNAAVERLVGPPEFQDSVLDAVKGWTFQPATENGVPVEQNLRRRFFFRMADPQEGGRSQVVSAYARAMALFNDGKPDDAVAAFQALLAEPDLNFYERCTSSFALARIYVAQNKFAEALPLIRDATIDNGKLLDKRAQESALRMQVRLEAANSNIAEALASFEILKQHVTVSDDDPDAKLVAKLHDMISSPKPFELAAVTSPAATAPRGGGGIWQHTLLKRSFGFGDIQGTLNGFDLRCKTHGIESAVSDKAEWTVPKSWTDCVIYVAGPPGTKFNFVEADPDPPAH